MANSNRPSTAIRARLSGGRRLPWCEVMRLALYEPGLGYYRRATQPIGRHGDFFTSVSVGPVFGELLALYCIQVWRTLGSPADFAIIEQGAHDGTLAADVLRGLQKHEPELSRCVRYAIVGGDETSRAAQEATLVAWGQQVFYLACLDENSPLPPHEVFLCNELVDAFPVHRVVFDAALSQWRESFVEERGGTLSFVSDEPSSEALCAELKYLPHEAPDGCTIEINLEMLPWLRGLASAPFQGAVLILDYGYTTAEWFDSGNLKGTLCRYRNHQSDDQVLEDLGECDLTSHVNFTRLAQAAEELAMPPVEFIEQGRFLTHAAGALLRGAGRVPDAAWLRQFQTLTHPGMMGRSFHALLLAKGIEPELLYAPENKMPRGAVSVFNQAASR